jgi:hypothetical protein
MMWNDHLYLAATACSTFHLGNPGPNTGAGFAYNTTSVAPYWRLSTGRESGTASWRSGPTGST